jgi:hypothetical protein
VQSQTITKIEANMSANVERTRLEMEELRNETKEIKKAIKD